MKMARPVNKGRPVNKAHAFAAAAIAAASMSAAGANADDAAEPTVTPAAVSTSETTGATIASYTRSEARDASADGRAVLHYGEGIWGADHQAIFITSREGVQTYALPGGEPGTVELFFDGKRYGRFTQDTIVDTAGAVYQLNYIKVHGVDPFAREQPVVSLGGAE
jgi:hypothetical protein